ncbi:MAG: type II secretion system F family protein [Calditrichia bacterium]
MTETLILERTSHGKPSRKTRPVSGRATREFTRELSVLLKARLQLTESLEMLQEQAGNKALREILRGVAKKVQSGASLAEGLRAYPKTFDTFLCSLVEVGELTGTLPQMLTRVAAYQQKMANLKRKFVQSMTYPLLVIGVAFSALTFIVMFVLPTFAGLFREFDAKLPWLTRTLMTISQFVNTHGLIMAVSLLMLLFLMHWALKQKAFRDRLDKWMLAAPLIGNTIRKNLLAQFCRTMGTLLESGVAFLPALDVAERTLTNSVMRSELQKIRRLAGRGGSIAASLDNSEIFPISLARIIGVGEETAELPAMLLQVADSYDEDLDAAVELLGSIIEPVMIVVLGIIIGVILISIYLPLFNMSTIMPG